MLVLQPRTSASTSLADEYKQRQNSPLSHLTNDFPLARRASQQSSNGGINSHSASESSQSAPVVPGREIHPIDDGRFIRVSSSFFREIALEAFSLEYVKPPTSQPFQDLMPLEAFQKKSVEMQQRMAERGGEDETNSSKFMSG